MIKSRLPILILTALLLLVATGTGLAGRYAATEMRFDDRFLNKVTGA
jgi:hypothetical protein